MLISFFYLLGSILSSTIITLIFKVFERYEVDTFQAIVINYLTCVVVGSLLIGDFPVEAGFAQEAWFPFALVLGVMFISTFYAIALTVQKFGVTVAIVLQKMSIIISVVFAIWMYSESVNAFKVAGIILALVAVILTNISPRKENEIAKKWTWFALLLPAFVFCVCGSIEVLLQYTQTIVLGGESGIRFTIFLFGTAGVIGLILLIINVIRGESKIQFKHILAGIALGVPNYFSIHFLLLVLSSGWEGSVVFPVNNIAIIVLAAVLAWLFFKEKLTPINILGIGIAALSIVLITLAK